MMTEISAVVLL